MQSLQTVKSYVASASILMLVPAQSLPAICTEQWISLYRHSIKTMQPLHSQTTVRPAYGIRTICHMIYLNKQGRSRVQAAQEFAPLSNSGSTVLLAAQVTGMTDVG